MTLSPAERMAAAKNRSRFPLTAEFSSRYDFPFDDFQINACRHVEEGKSVLVTAPTGAGKTIVGEFAAFMAEEKGERCFYTTPIKALSNQKFQEALFRSGFMSDRLVLAIQTERRRDILRNR